VWERERVCVCVCMCGGQGGGGGQDVCVRECDRERREREDPQRLLVLIKWQANGSLDPNTLNCLCPMIPGIHHLKWATISNAARRPTHLLVIERLDTAGVYGSVSPSLFSLPWSTTTLPQRCVISYCPATQAFHQLYPPTTRRHPPLGDTLPLWVTLWGLSSPSLQWAHCLTLSDLLGFLWSACPPLPTPVKSLPMSQKQCSSYVGGDLS